MTIDEALDACAAFPATELSYPFGPEAAVFKVVGKVYAIVGIADHPRLTLKCDPQDAAALVATYTEITPGYHMNKKHWISVDLPSAEAPAQELISDAYRLVVASLPRDQRPA
jgi:predicted DNA-binding protein (MmcQ/YjbR family)